MDANFATRTYCLIRLFPHYKYKVRLRAALASKRKHLETQIRSEIVRVVKLVSRYMLLIDYSTCTHLLFGASNLDSGNGIQWKVAADFGL